MNNIDRILNNNDFVLILPVKYNKVKLSFSTKLGDRRGVVIEGELAVQLLSLYSRYDFTDKLIIGSLDYPHGRKLRNLLESGISTEDELINDVILGAM